MKTNTITAGAVLRLTQESDIALLPAIERSAAQAFRQIPSLAWLADSEVISVARHHDYLETEHSLLAVAAGLPLLSGGRGGLGVFMAPSAGYLVGYAFAAGVTGALMARLPAGTPLRAAVSAFAASVLGGLVFLHALGIAGLVVLAQMPLRQAFMVDLAFVPGDLVKCVLCALVVHTVAKALPDWRMGGRA